MAESTIHIRLIDVEPVAEAIRKAGAVVVAWNRLGKCEDEFMPDYPHACGEYRDELDTAIGNLERHLTAMVGREAEGMPRPDPNPRLKGRG